MVWRNQPLVVYHGTYDQAAGQMIRPAKSLPNAVDLSVGRSFLDFGKGFYTTTVLEQAVAWANNRAWRMRASAVKTPYPVAAAVVAFEIDRTMLGRLESLVFLTDRDSAGFWELVEQCRQGAHPMHGRTRPYDVVYGPVTDWPRGGLLPGYTQISFHTEHALSVLESLRISHIGRPFV